MHYRREKPLLPLHFSGQSKARVLITETSIANICNKIAKIRKNIANIRNNIANNCNNIANIRKTIVKFRNIIANIRNKKYFLHFLPGTIGLP